jgi:antitoxin FitA
LETLEIKLTDQTVARLEAAAERLGLTPAQLLEISLEEKLSRLDKDFLDAAQYVLEKNAELYNRLA